MSTYWSLIQLMNICCGTRTFLSLRHRWLSRVIEYPCTWPKWSVKMWYREVCLGV